MIRHILAEAFNALTHYKLRSALTMLSVTWGIASLVLLLSYGHGFGVALVQAFDQIGKDLIVIFPGQTSQQAGGERAGRRILLELRDVEALREGVPTIEAISPEVRRFLPVNFGYRTRNYNVDGVYAAFERIRRTDVAVGRFLSEDDVLQRRRVAVIGANLRKELFSGLPAVGNDIKINGVRFTVIGVLKKKTQITNYEPPDDMTAFVPFTTLATIVNTRYLNNIVVLPANNHFRNRIVSDLRTALARVHNFSVRDERALRIMDWNQFRAIVTDLSLGLKVLLTVIGTLTLSIGAVGVMNIMLVSVTQRTREIGVLKALGARRQHILGQILLEGLVLTATGGLFGYLVAALATYMIGSLPLLGPLFEDTSGQGDIHLRLSFSALLVSSLVLIVVGLAAGIVPAIRAARLDPAQAIRSE
jgi:putative ABC transport system permease protein